MHFISVVSGVSSDSSAAEVVEALVPVVDHFVIHARKCWLSGVCTRKNRRVPPLKYDWVFQLLDDFPTLDFTLNGGVLTFSDIQGLLSRAS